MLSTALVALSSIESAHAQIAGLEGDSWLLGVFLGLGTGLVGVIVFWLKKRSAGQQKSKKKKYLDPVKVIMGLIVAVGIGCFALSKLQYIKQEKEIEEKKVQSVSIEKKGYELDSLPLLQAKAKHETALVRESASGLEYDNDVPDWVKKVDFKSDGRQLMAWVLIPKKQKRSKMPAVIFAHDSEVLSLDNIDLVKPFVDAGFIVMLPAWRGENGNSGFQEYCFGEVDDAVNAVEYLSERSAVDKGNIFVCGHGIGATIAMLLAESSFNVKKVAACGGNPNLLETGAADTVPFKTTKVELRLRSPAMYVKDINCPLLLLYGDKGKKELQYLVLAQKMAEDAVKADKSVSVETIAGSSHSSSISKAIPKMIEFFSKDLKLEEEEVDEDESDDETADAESSSGKSKDKEEESSKAEESPEAKESSQSSESSKTRKSKKGSEYSDSEDYGDYDEY